MSDPISTLNQLSAPNLCLDDDGEGGVSGAPAAPAAPTSSDSAPPSAPEPNVCAAPPSAVQALVSKFSAPPPPPKASSASVPVSISTRTLTTSSGAVAGGSYRVGGSLLTQQIHLGPLQSTLEVGAASVQYGADASAQIALARRTTSLAGGGYSLSVVADALTAGAHLGEHNDDGSIGGHIGSGAELAGAEATLNTPYGSLTGGASVSLSLSGSMGVRDADHDGKPEFCAKFSIPAYTLGACVEQFW